MSEEQKKDVDIRRNLDDINISYQVQLAMRGNREAARELAKITARYLEDDEEFPDTLKPYLTFAFKKIAEGKSADQALFLKHSPGKKDYPFYKMEFVANEVARVHLTGQAKTVKEACAMVAASGRLMLDTETLYKYYYKIFPGGTSQWTIIPSKS